MATQLKTQIRFPWNRMMQELAIPDTTQCFLGGELPTIEDVSEAVVSALSNPIEFPPLAVALVPGDHVVVTVEPGIPALPELLLGIKRYLESSFRVPSKVTVLLTEIEQDLADSLSTLVAPWGVQVHRPNSQRHHAYLAASTDADPIYVNRLVADADFILPCRLIRSESAHHNNGIYGIAPYFFDVATHERFAKAELLRTDRSASSVGIANEVGEMLGIQFALSVVPNADVRIGGILAGAPKASHAAANEIRLRNFPVLMGGKFDLVLAIVEGHQNQQSWENVVRAAVAADQLASDGGSILVASQILRLPPELGISESESEERFFEHNSNSAHLSEFNTSRQTIDRIRRKRPFYFLSNVPAEEVEQLGLCHVDSWKEVEHLLGHHSRSVVLGSAQYR